ncbi:Na(+)/H(+) exchange regulatory cofactor NHE-RF2 [Brienomyrus brachyistius]|uniref:Na(+)/H(+) exchange regulatory cofactor NHE-RF2 n=1 Tax=Brienomyrus brachyistius TaxID=42636 RepID=UPI0020B41D0A|nr:Na(+)/H(+) exchange regulatory cofactor NHE-RF2 [Brienomyrus brachyistius]
MAAELKPRLCVIKKADSGYGFHLHGEKGRSGQYIRKVEPASPADIAGLRTGDRVLEVNGDNVEKETHYQVVQRIRAVPHETRLLVVDNATDEHLRRLQLPYTAEPTAPSAPREAENGRISTQPAPSADAPPKPIDQPLSLSTKKETDPPVIKQQPRLCRLAKSEQGYGFNLHSDKTRPGQFIRSVDPGSPAEKAGLQPKDRLVEVNGVNIENLRHADVVALIKRGGSEARLLVVDPDTDEHFKKQGVIPLESHVEGRLTTSITNGSRKSWPSDSSTSQSSQSTSSELSNPDASTQVPEDDKRCLLDPFVESGLRLSPTAAEAKRKAQAKRGHKRAPQMDWNKKYEIFSNF